LEDWLVTKDDIVMITKDIEFDLKFVENKSFLIDESESVNGCVILIDAFMSQFDESESVKGCVILIDAFMSQFKK
jgi:hypothetical protein